MPIGKNVQLGKDVRIFHPDLVNLYDCVIGDGTWIGTFVEIQVGAKIGSRCKISSHTFICECVTIEDEVFVGHGVMFINDKFPRATTDDGALKWSADWKIEPTRICRRALTCHTFRRIRQCSASRARLNAASVAVSALTCGRTGKSRRRAKLGTGKVWR